MVNPKEFKKNIKRKNYSSNFAIMSALKLEEKIISDSSEVAEYESTYLFYSLPQDLIRLLDYVFFKNILSTLVTKSLLNYNTWKICSIILQKLYRLNSREEKILFDLHYDLRSKLNFEKAKNLFKHDQFEAKLFFDELLKSTNLDWRVTYRSLFFCLVLAKIFESDERPIVEEIITSNPNFPFKDLVNNFLG
jgi:hypothetical protein